jgi:transcriptional regulator with XRE-family HTH domain
MRNKEYRDSFVAAHLSTNIAAQLKTIRESQDITQKALAAKSGMSAARISVMENPSYDKFNISTLRRLASALDVALVVKFIAFSELVDWVSNLSPDKIAAPSFESDSIREGAPPQLLGTALDMQPPSAEGRENLAEKYLSRLPFGSQRGMESARQLMPQPRGGLLYGLQS